MKTQKDMKNVMKNLALLLAILFTANIQAQVKSDYDKSVDFSKIKTYTFAGWEKDSDKILNDFDKNELKMLYKTNLVLED